ncbi:MAG TPA: phosphoribosylformylglycinamidine synthase subunit PurQ [Candidatus Binatia bacterium]|nr:phosphoribosylformylglycinamidine synthase subunit PurQ [Candidatus Binatia bacterium]
MKFGIAVFPGTWSDRDCARAVEVLGHSSVYLWHRDRDLQGADCVILPGGFSYGDHLRTGAVARFAPLMDSVQEFAAAGGLVIGICNGFQILCEAHLLPGALTRNASLEFRCETTWLRVETAETPFTRECRAGEVLAIPISHGEGRYVADPETLDRLDAERRVAFRYVRPDGSPAGDASPNGSMRDIAGIVNETRNVLGMMPHPERAAEAVLGGEDGMRLFRSILGSVEEAGTFAPTVTPAAVGSAPAAPGRGPISDRGGPGRRAPARRVMKETVHNAAADGQGGGGPGPAGEPGGRRRRGAAPR